METLKDILASLGLPHMRGGVSDSSAMDLACVLSSPHAWGCFLQKLKKPPELRVFPTCVGVFPPYCSKCYARTSLPHMRGGVSKRKNRAKPRRTSSPHAWGCFFGRKNTHLLHCVFPTCVGVFPRWPLRFVPGIRLPHMRGGVSLDPQLGISHIRSSPHAWGCFQIMYKGQPKGCVFPTCVGVFLSSSYSARSLACLPHMRGGVSLLRTIFHV